MKREAVQLLIAKALYDACYEPKDDIPRESIPSPGWAWEKTSQQQRDFCLHQADFVIDALDEEHLFKEAECDLVEAVEMEREACACIAVDTAHRAAAAETGAGAGTAILIARTIRDRRR